MATPHINAEMGDFADVVLMPGDPLRAKHIAETFLENPVEVNNVRGMLGYTGTYKGRKVSVMGHGMGIPSCSIYTKELITDFGVKKIIRVGSCGAVRADVKLRDIVIGMGACTILLRLLTSTWCVTRLMRRKTWVLKRAWVTSSLPISSTPRIRRCST
jgi:purine-nucleoside phosphorylase